MFVNLLGSVYDHSPDLEAYYCKENVVCNSLSELGSGYLKLFGSGTASASAVFAVSAPFTGVVETEVHMISTSHGDCKLRRGEGRMEGIMLFLPRGLAVVGTPRKLPKKVGFQMEWQSAWTAFAYSVAWRLGLLAVGNADCTS
jgi:hypothetical protein